MAFDLARSWERARLGSVLGHTATTTWVAEGIAGLVPDVDAIPRGWFGALRARDLVDPLPKRLIG